VCFYAYFYFRIALTEAGAGSMICCHVIWYLNLFSLNWITNFDDSYHKSCGLKSNCWPSDPIPHDLNQIVIWFASHWCFGVVDRWQEGDPVCRKPDSGMPKVYLWGANITWSILGRLGQEGKGENYQVCSVQYCVQQLCTVRCTHIWTD